MKAAVVHSFQAAPELADFPEPAPEADEVLIQVKAAALSQLVRAQAAGKMYGGSSLPFVPGADGVGLLDGKRVYFAFPRPPVGALAELVAVKRAQLIPLPEQLDDLTAAAAANPGMSSWVALTRRAGFKRGESVLINGATGSSGRLAIQVAKHLGAGRVVATGRKPESEAALRGLGADAYITLEQPRDELVAAFRREIQGPGVSVVLDYLFGASAEAFISACIGPARGAAEPRIRFVQVGAMTGPNIALPAAALRSSGLELLGSGFGAASHQELVAAIAELFAVYASAVFHVEAEAVPLTDVSAAFGRSGGPRIVLTL